MLTSAFISFGYGAVGPLFNVAFHEGDVRAGETDLGFMFAAGELALAAATLLVPLLAVRMLKVDAIAATRLLALPFVIGMGRCRSCSARSSCCSCLWAARTSGG